MVNYSNGNNLTRSEQDLVNILAGSTGFVPLGTIMQLMYEVNEKDIQENTLRTFVRNIRVKLGKDSVETASGKGYRLADKFRTSQVVTNYDNVQKALCGIIFAAKIYAEGNNRISFLKTDIRTLISAGIISEDNIRKHIPGGYSLIGTN